MPRKRSLAHVHEGFDKGWEFIMTGCMEEANIAVYLEQRKLWTD